MLPLTWAAWGFVVWLLWAQQGLRTYTPAVRCLGASLQQSGMQLVRPTTLSRPALAASGCTSLLLWARCCCRAALCYAGLYKSVARPACVCIIYTAPRLGRLRERLARSTSYSCDNALEGRRTALMGHYDGFKYVYPPRIYHRETGNRMCQIPAT